MFSQYVYLLNSDVGMSLSDRKLASKHIIEFQWRSRGKEFLSIWRERSFRIYNAVKEIQKFMRKRRKKIGQSKLRKKKTLASISSARALSRLFGCLMNTLRIKPYAKCAINSLLLCNGRLVQTKCANREAFPIVTNTKTVEDKCSETKKKKER